MVELARRDDVPMEVIEELEKLFPGCDIKFAGQFSDADQQEIQELFPAQDVAEEEKKLVLGLCVDCGKKIPGEWPPVSDDYQFPLGWCLFSDIVTDLPAALQCPECDEKEEQSGTR
jgi:hypothetical protein